MTWTVDGATVLVTGATDGLGRALAERLAGAGACVLAHGRDRQRVDDTVAALDEAASCPPRGYVADFADLAQVRRLADEVAGDHRRLHVLVNNAGLGSGPSDGAPRQTSHDGHELRLQVNYLAAYLLSRRLLPLLRAAAPGRIVNVASGAQQAVDFDDLMLESGYDGWRAYSQSKFAMVADTFALAARLDPAEVTVNSLHPASLMDTKMVREAFGQAQRPLDEGVDAVWRLVADPELEGVTGRYFNGRAPAQPSPQTTDPEVQAELEHRAEALTAT